MSSLELTESQKTVLQELVDLSRESENAVKGEAIANQIDRNAGTIRNQMQSLKALQLVEGAPRPKGGYLHIGCRSRRRSDSLSTARLSRVIF